jgi:hypothetical protein
MPSMAFGGLSILTKSNHCRQPVPTVASEKMNRFDEMQFRATVDRALVTVSKILDTTKHPARAADVPHVYDDKFGLVEQATKAALVATANAMEVFGASGAALDGMRNWVKANKVRKERLFLSQI